MEYTDKQYRKLVKKHRRWSDLQDVLHAEFCDKPSTECDFQWFY